MPQSQNVTRPGLKVWGEATALLREFRRAGWFDLLLLGGLIGLVFGALSLAGEWRLFRPEVRIDLSPSALPIYAFYSLSRGLIAYALSLLFTLAYGYWAAKDRLAERVLLPLLDILQSIPVLGFMPGLVLALVALFPRSNVGLELASIVMIFSGQAWNMTFSFYHSLRSIPKDQIEAATTYRFDWWQRLKWVELPFSTIGLVWNSMMSMAGGWFFLMITESFVLGAKDFRLPGIGSYMSVAVAKGDVRAMLWAIFAMILMIVILDQLLWRPVVVWSQKFRVEESAEEQSASSWFYDWLQRSRIIEAVAKLARSIHQRVRGRKTAHERAPSSAIAPERSSSRVVSIVLFTVLMGGLLFGASRLVTVLRPLHLREFGPILRACGWTLGRVLLSTAFGTVWALPAGLAIGLSPRLSRVLQPVVQVAASFPAPMLFPLVIAGLKVIGVSLGWGSIVLMLLGTQWYILFNVIAGAMAIPSDLREAADSYRLDRWLRFKSLYLPAVFPFLVTGWVTAAGGAWNASIVAEFVTFRGQVLTTDGLGAMISGAAERADFPHLAASVMVMAATVVLFNRIVWRRLYRVAEERFSLSK
ncbi:MAG: ABC transporter permease subunit [Acidobacteria bacterium]|nr:ABC transporter permease subunit [Acidobacteriota bacterium]MBV9067968.1 ABC transporter permease subunit [Acidobacteriota bacterium]MBV9186164.1 ABC transporter permease subunit [Acidobacteriota bacterium]